MIEILLLPNLQLHSIKPILFFLQSSVLKFLCFAGDSVHDALHVRVTALFVLFVFAIDGIVDILKGVFALGDAVLEAGNVAVALRES